MKIRSDFVTNSSSSSFIIGKKDDASVTIESVYQTVKHFYKELLAVRDAAIEYVSKHPKMKIEYVKKENYETFECTEKNSEKRWKLYDEFEEKCGLSMWECFSDLDWLECETYLDYERYWLDKMQDHDYKIHAPFTIADFLEEKEINWLHFYLNEEYGSKTHKINSKSNIIDWYFPYIEEAFEYSETCEGCKRVEYCEYCQEECKDARNVITTKNIPEDKACLYLLGRVCIHSESGYIPQYVVEKLGEISEHYCNHMG